MDLLPANSSEEKIPKVTAEEAREMFFYDCSEFNKGTVAGPDDIGSQRCMMLGIHHKRNKLAGLDLAIPTVLDETCAELKRLIEHPEILPQGTGRFLEMMAGELELLLDTIQLKQTYGQGHQESVKQHRKRILAGYDENRTAWQQFLHDKAPGSGFPKEQMHQFGSTQMATAAFQLLVLHKTEEYTACSKALEEARRGPLPPRKDTLAGKTPHRDYIRRTDWKTYLPTSKRPAPREPGGLEQNMSLQSLANAYRKDPARLAGTWTRVRLQPQTFRVNLINEFAITEMRRLIRLAQSRDRT
ncbi:MAG: hypothetical protein Q9226_000308 [Calogaya cf. arnoldii]